MAIATNSAHQRLRVFVSSTTEDLSTERAAARAAIENLRLHPILIDLDARAYPASRGDLTEVDDSDIFIAIYGERYGSASGGEVSDLEGEYVAAGEKPKLIYLKSSSPERDPRLTDMIERITESAAVSYKSFNDARELQELIENDLATLLSEAYDAHPTQPPPVPEVRVEARLPSDVTSFVGREDEVRAIHDLLRSKGARLVTITGPGGVGKSRVAIRAARSFVAEMEVSFVDLSALSSGSLVVPTIAERLGVRASDESPLEVALEQRLAAGPVLLVLDNFEQVLDAARDVARLLKRIPHLKVLVTSRAVLRVRGECEFTLEPFPIPEGGPSDLGDEPAVRLFVERAHAVRPDLELGGAQLAIVTEICARLDGLPLAIELAAARVRLLSLDGLLQRLADRFALLSGGPRDLPDRQRTLRDTIDWSFQMLDEEEQSVFTSLGVFVGGRTLEAAEAVCNSDGTYDVLSAIASLVENSLLRRVETPDGESRFTMLESIHEFAREQLAASGRAAEVHRRHADYFRAFAEKAAARFRGPDGSAWIRRMVDEHGNIRAALSWARANEPRLLLPLIAAVAPFWMVHGDLGEALDWTQAGLASGEGDAHRRAEVMLHQAEIHWGLGRRDQAAEAYEECRKLYEELADEAGLDLALRGEARIALDIGDYERARDVYETSLRLRRKMGWTQGAAETLNNLGLVASLRGDHAGAVRLLEESVSLFSELEDRQGVARGALNLAVSLQALGEFDRAERLGKESLRTWWELEGKWDVADCLEALGEIAVDRHDLRKGMILLEAADRLRDDIAAPRAPYDEEAFVAARERARSGLGDESEDVALTARAMPLERVIDLALSSSDGSARP